jgi:hypothetical protein
MRRTIGWLAAASLVLAVACKKEEKAADTKKTPPKPTPADAAAPPPAPPDAAMAVVPPPDDKKLAGKGQMQHCPSAVEGAATKVENTDTGVTVTITAKDEKDAKSVDEIRKRAKHLVESSKKDPTEMQHTGDGSGGGGGGMCPVVLQDSTLTAKDVPGGSAVSVNAKDKAKVAALQGEAKARADKLAAGGAPK